MTAHQVLENYANLSYLETIKFDILYQDRIKHIKEELELTKRTYIVPVHSMSPEKAEQTLTGMMSVYTEPVNVEPDLFLLPNYITPNVKFTEADIKDKARLEKMVEKEALAIFNSDKARKGRDLDTVKFNVRQGKIAELYLIENFGYEEADKKWHDLRDSSGNYAEVKAYNVWSKDAPFVQKDLMRIRNEGWNTSKWYILFKCNYGEYELLDKIQIR